MRLGQPYADFWDLTLAEFTLISGALQKRERDRFERDQSLNWQLANLIGVAVNAPKEFPKLEELRGKSDEDMTEQQGANRMRAAFLGLVAAQSRQRKA